MHADHLADVIHCDPHLSIDFPRYVISTELLLDFCLVSFSFSSSVCSSRKVLRVGFKVLKLKRLFTIITAFLST